LNYTEARNLYRQIWARDNHVEFNGDWLDMHAKVCIQHTVGFIQYFRFPGYR
jgi:hypothetical protein